MTDRHLYVDERGPPLAVTTVTSSRLVCGTRCSAGANPAEERVLEAHLPVDRRYWVSPRRRIAAKGLLLSRILKGPDQRTPGIRFRQASVCRRQRLRFNQMTITPHLESLSRNSAGVSEARR